MKINVHRYRLRLASVVLLASTGIAVAAGLSPDDDRYLSSKFGVVQQGDVPSGRALQHSHDMVPINLPPEERAGLAAYINSFR